MVAFLTQTQHLQHLQSKFRILKGYVISYGPNTHSTLFGVFSTFPDLKKAHVYPFDDIGTDPDSYLLNSILQIAFLEVSSNKDKMELLAQDLCALLKHN